jgi:putative glycerol-1-phosphate prenyltransferase
MNNETILYEKILKQISLNKKMLGVLIDPDKYLLSSDELLYKINICKPDFILVGGSLTFQSVEKTVETLKKNTCIPVVLFPGNALQFTEKADALLYLSLLSGRNPEFLIGQHVLSAYSIKKSGLEVLSTGYLLVDGGKSTSVEYLSNTKPIPSDKPDIAIATAIAGELLGNKLIYLEAGSGAEKPVPPPMISAVKKNIRIPLIVGGGIRSVEALRNAFAAGADIVICGNVLEKDPVLLEEFIQETKHWNRMMSEK